MHLVALNVVGLETLVVVGIEVCRFPFEATAVLSILVVASAMLSEVCLRISR